MRDRIAVVMPLYNEERHVARVLQRMSDVVDQVFVVDDGCTDGSVAEVLRVADARVRVVRHGARRGVGGALATGFAEALRQGAEIFVTVDADGQMDPEDLPALLEPLHRRDATYVKGCRFHPAIAIDRMPRHRRIANRILTRVTARILDEPRLRDAHCGYTAARRDVVAGLDLARLHASYGVYTDILSQVLRQPSPRVAYVPVQAVYGDETSHLRARDAIGLARLLVRQWRLRPPRRSAELSGASPPT